MQKNGGVFWKMRLNHSYIRFLYAHNTSDRNKESHLLPIRYLPSLQENEEDNEGGLGRSFHQWELPGGRDYVSDSFGLCSAGHIRDTHSELYVHE